MSIPTTCETIRNKTTCIIIKCYIYSGTSSNLLPPGLACGINIHLLTGEARQHRTAVAVLQMAFPSSQGVVYWGLHFSRSNVKSLLQLVRCCLSSRLRLWCKHARVFLATIYMITIWKVNSSPINIARSNWHGIIKICSGQRNAKRALEYAPHLSVRTYQRNRTFIYPRTCGRHG